LEDRLAYLPGGVFMMGSREEGSEVAPFEAEVGRFWIGRHEVIVAEYAEYWNDAAVTNGLPDPLLERRADRVVPRSGCARQPMAFVSYDDARAFCEWLSARTGRRVRLPTEREWEYAARGGVRGARFPWGWGNPRGRACFDAGGPVRVGSYRANGFGLHDLAGNVFEWCALPESEEGAAEAPARGGSWAESDARTLRVFHRERFPRGYRDADMGFRVAVEPLRGMEAACLR
jgi:formylglycine-generating enzyme required for sulfatase activity